MPLIAAMVTARPLENSGSTKAAACGSRQKRSPTTREAEYWSRRVPVHGRIGRACSRWRATVGKRATMRWSSSSGVPSGSGYWARSSVRPTLHRPLVEAGWLSNGITQIQPPSNRWWSVPCASGLGRPCSRRGGAQRS